MKKIKIAIIGLGTAGRARLSAVQSSSHFELAGVVSRRSEFSTLSLEEVLQDPSIEAVAISTENALHGSQVWQVLQSQKHVLCDYPLCFSETEARQLFTCAQDQKKVLHVEHIALLMQSHQILKTQIPHLGSFIEGEFRFTAGWNPSLQDLSRQGPFPFLCESRLVQLSDLLGAFEVESSSVIQNEQQAELRLQLGFASGGRIFFQETRAVHLKRERYFRARFEKGEIGWPGVVEPRGLFEKDLEHFYKRVRLGSKNYYDEEQMIKILGMLEKL
ncbi:MAG: Gfo/Idh/MocA family oxidoreductase [Deltaproteobacteria bacterium]|nr:Gfo/Idh/MocA family oxidoreductase [Deltaproteobacteria bacterium]